MKKYKDLYGKDYNLILTEGFANSLCVLFGGEDLNFDSGVFVDLVNCSGRVKKALIYCPLSVAEWVVESQAERKSRIVKVAPLQIKTVTAPNSSSYASLFSMLSAKTQSRKTLKDRDSIRTVFDVLRKQGVKSLLVSSSKKISEYLEGRATKVVAVTNGVAAINKTLEEIKKNEYDFIFVVDRDYSDSIKTSLPLSKQSSKTLDEIVSRFELLSDATDVYWHGDVLLGFCPDKGCSAFVLGSKSGSICVADSNVSHFFAVKNLSNDA